MKLLWVIYFDALITRNNFLLKLNKINFVFGKIFHLLLVYVEVDSFLVLFELVFSTVY